MLDMNPKVREAWVRALRSGQYPQGTNYLHVAADDPNDRWEGFCCLGVLCELAVQAGVIPPARHMVTPTGRRVWEYGVPGGEDGDGASHTSLPWAVSEWAGIPGDTDPTIAFRVEDEDGNPDVGHRPASDLNDNLGLTFEEIAAAIEEAVQ
jgi:hypothetical protein